MWSWPASCTTWLKPAPSPISSPILPGCSGWRRSAARICPTRPLPYRSARWRRRGPTDPCPSGSTAPASRVGRGPGFRGGDTSGAGLPGLVWLHGGGFAGGTLDMREADQVARELADRTGGLVFSVDYRLARDGVHFPVPHEDVARGLDLGGSARRGAWRGPREACASAVPAPAGISPSAPPCISRTPAWPCPPSCCWRTRSCTPRFALWSRPRCPTPGCSPACRGSCASPRTTAGQWWRTTSAAPPAWRPRMPCPATPIPRGSPRWRSSPANTMTCVLRPSSSRESLRAAGVPVDFRLEAGATHGYLNHSAALGIVQQGLAFLAAELASAKPFQ